MSGNVTIKGGGGFDVPWIVAEAPEGVPADQQVAHQRAYILAAFGMDAKDPDIVNLSLAEVIAAAGFHFQGIVSRAGGNRRNQGGQGRARSADLGETAQAPAEEPQAPVSEPPAPPATESKAPKREAASSPLEPEAVAEVLGAEIIEDTKVHEHQDVLDEIAAADNKKALQAIFHGNKDAMKGDVLEALQAKAKEL